MSPVPVCFKSMNSATLVMVKRLFLRWGSLISGLLPFMGWWLTEIYSSTSSTNH